MAGAVADGEIIRIAPMIYSTPPDHVDVDEKLPVAAEAMVAAISHEGNNAIAKERNRFRNRRL
jgi:hypothetical protein